MTASSARRARSRPRLTASPTGPACCAARAVAADISLTAGTVLHRTHTPLSTWFWAAFLVGSSTPGMCAVQLQRQLGLTSYETAFQILHKLRASMVRHAGRIGRLQDHVEVDETLVGGETRGKGQGFHDLTCVIGAVEVRQRVTKPEREDGTARRSPVAAGATRAACASPCRGPHREVPARLRAGARRTRGPMVY